MLDFWNTDGKCMIDKLIVWILVLVSVSFADVKVKVVRTVSIIVDILEVIPIRY